MRCRWCHSESAHRVEIEPYAGDGKPAIWAEVCGDCFGRLAQQPEPIERLRRKHARNVPQLSIFDVLEAQPDSAIGI